MENHRFRENTSDKRLRQLFNQLDNTPNRRYNTAGYTALRQRYHVMLDAHQNRKVAEKKAEKKRLKKNVIDNALVPVQSTFNSYWKYTIPASLSNYLEVKMRKEVLKLGSNVNLKRYTTNLGVLEIGDTQFRNWTKQIYKFIKPVIVNSLLANICVKAWAVISMKCYNNGDTDERDRYFVQDKNLGSIIVTSEIEFKNHFYKNAFKAYTALNGHDYIQVYGIGSIDVNVFKFNALSGSSYTPFPDCITLSKSVINIKNTDNDCFRWCCIASRHLPSHHAERIAHYNNPDFINEWKISDKDLPMKLNRIPFFEKANSVNVNVYTLESDDKTKIPLHISKQNNEETINLFYYNNHYGLIKNFSRFVGGDHNHVCPNCLAKYANTDCYKRHLSVCRDLNENGSLVKMPKHVEKIDENGKKYTVKSVTQFDDYSKQKKLPVVIYADFEANLQSNDIVVMKNQVAEHKANTFRLRINSVVDLGIPLDYCYSGTDCDVKFVELLINELEEKIHTKLNEYSEKNKKPILTADEEKQFHKETDCRFCNRKLEYFNIKKKVKVNDRVRDHDHFTGKYEGASHAKCNIKATQLFKGKIKIPVIFHNANYDIRCFIHAFKTIKGDESFVESISGVPCNMEIYKSLNINSFSIICSYAHLSSSLAKLIENLPDEKKILMKSICDDEAKFKLICEKGFYPYEMIDCQEKLDIPIQELKREHFNSKLNLSKLDDHDWEHIQRVIQVFNMKSFREFHELYLKVDVYGLHDVFEYYRELSMNTYGLDPAHFIGLPSFTWSAGLKHTGVKLDDITDVDMYMFCEKWKKGGVSVISHRYAKANNPYLPDFDEKQDKSYILQVDCNNLYGWAMSQKLPISDFKWTDITSEEIINYNNNSNTGYALEVDLHYPSHLHDEHNDYPLAPEHMMLGKVRKLTPNLNDKKNYIVHIDNLKYYISKGLILTKVHRVLQFTQSNWLDTYISHNSKLRQQAKNDFEKDYYKLLNNAFYGKTMENVRERVNVQFCLDKKKFDKHTSSPLFANQVNIFQEDGLALVKTHKKSIELNKPIYIGACVLDLSKLLMFKFHYDTMKVKYPKCEMMKTDTDSLLYFIKTDDVYLDMKNDHVIQKQMEFSNYPKNHMLYNNDRKKVPGLFQDECVDGSLTVVSEYIGLRAKSYVNKLFYVEENEYDLKKKSKGVNSKHLKNRIGFEDYKNCLFHGINKSLDKMYAFRSKNMKTYSIQQSKICLSGNDDKRIIQEDKIHTLAIGHYKIVA